MKLSLNDLLDLVCFSHPGLVTMADSGFYTTTGSDYPDIVGQKLNLTVNLSVKLSRHSQLSTI